MLSKKKSISWKVKYLKLISKKYRIINELRRRVIDQYLQIEDYQRKSSEFQFSFLQTSGASSYESYLNNIQQLLKANSDWYENSRKLKERYLAGLSSTNLHPSCSFRQQILNIEQQYNDLVVNFRNSKILSAPLSITENLAQKTDQAQYVAGRLKSIRDNLHHFIEYYEWRKFYISLIPLQKKLIDTLIASGCKKWADTFLSWYYYWLLALNESTKLPKNDDVLKELLETKKNFSTSQVNNIIQYWITQQKTSVTHARSQGLNPISLFNKRGSKGERRNSLRKILQADFSLFTDFFPVLMLSPSVCSSILPLKEGMFDVVLFDEASQLRLEDTFPALTRGKIKIISGDSQQMPPSSYFQGGATLLNPTEEDFDDESEQSPRSSDMASSLNLADSESLLEYAENAGYSQSPLKIHYRSQHPYLIDFSNHAFYGSSLKPMPAKVNYKPIKYVQVNGKYEDQINRDEARQVVDILINHIRPDKDGKYPSVGIATLNLYQRNLILEEITKARQIKPEYDKKISDLGAELFVKNLENIQGDERDIIIISTTFGRRVDSSFRQNFGPLLQRNGYKLLNVIITRAKYKVFVCTSIPEEHILRYPELLNQYGNTGRGIFYAYLAYAKAISEGNETSRQVILGQLDANCQSKTFDIEHDVYGSESPFEEEVYYALASKIGQDRLEQQHPVGGFRIDLVVKSKLTGTPIIAIECDGAKYHSSHEAYSWDMFRQKQIFDQYGYKFYRIWSTNWFNSLEKELKSLLAFIEMVDKNETQNSTNVPVPLFEDIDIIPISLLPENKKRVALNSIAVVKNPEGKVMKIRFSKTPNSTHLPDKDGIIAINEKSPLGLALLGKAEGETCQLGMLEVYYQITQIY